MLDYAIIGQKNGRSGTNTDHDSLIKLLKAEAGLLYLHRLCVLISASTICVYSCMNYLWFFFLHCLFVHISALSICLHFWIDDLCLFLYYLFVFFSALSICV
jgi:hypothetical protein